MRNSRWLRVGLATIVVGCGASGAFLVACGDDDVTPAVDGGGGGTDTGTSDSPTGDSATDSGTDSGPKLPNAKLVVVNAATDFGPAANIPISASANLQAVRVCFALAADVTAVMTANASPLPPQPDGPKPPFGPPGIYIGTGGIFKSFGLDLEPLALRPIVMNAKTLQEKGIIKPGPGLPGPTCDEILKAGATLDGATFQENVDYWKLAPIPPNTLKKGSSYAVVLTGCADDAVVTNNEQCGPGFTPTGNPGPGNLQARVYELTKPATVPATEVAAQFAHVSSSASWFLDGNGPGGAIIPVVPGFQDTTTPGSTFKPVPGKGDGGAVALYELTAVKNVSGVDFANHAFTANPQAPFAAPLPLIQASSFPAGPPDGGAYANGKAMTFFAVGDPTTPTDAGVGVPNPRGFHYLAFPNDPPVETYVP